MAEPDRQPYEAEPPPIAPPRQHPVPLFAPEILPEIAPNQAVCLQCGYQIRGLATSGNCPECGTPIARSMRGNLLEFSSTGYVQSLHLGLTIILIVVVAQFALTILLFLGVVIGSIRPAGGTSLKDLELWVNAIALPLTAAMLYGWWQFSAPDPAILGTEKGQSARTTIRASVVIVAVVSVFELLIRAIAAQDTRLATMGVAASGLNAVANIVQFFASLLYVRWLAPRLPDRSIQQQAAKYLWLLPLIYIVGLCVLVGPLIATVMYFLLLNQVRAKLMMIRQRQPENAASSVTA